MILIDISLFIMNFMNECYCHCYNFFNLLKVNYVFICVFSELHQNFSLEELKKYEILCKIQIKIT